MAGRSAAHSFILTLAAAVGLGLAACEAPREAAVQDAVVQEVVVAEEVTVTQASVVEEMCDLENYRILVGMTEPMLEFVLLPPEHRILGPETAATTDYVSTRLNIWITDEPDGPMVSRISCG